MKILFLIILMFFSIHSTAIEKKYQSHRSILATAKAAMEARHKHQLDQVKIRVHRLDRRLKLAQCDIPLTGMMSDNRQDFGRTTIGVSCEGKKPWTIYVSLTVDVFKPVVVAKKSIPRGKKISADDIDILEKNVSSLRFGYLQTVNDALGKVAKRNINSGKILTSVQIAPPKIVRRGERVTIITGNGQFNVRMAGKALMDGTLGKRIRVQNISSKRVIEAIVDGPGIVKVFL